MDKKRVSQSKKAGLVFPVQRIKRYVKAKTKLRVSQTLPVYLAAVVEYMCAEVLELAGNAAIHNKRRRVTPRHIFLAVSNDEELHKMLQRVIIPQGGVLPQLLPELLTKAKQKKLAEALKQQQKTKQDSVAVATSPMPESSGDETGDESPSHTSIPGVEIILEKKLPYGPKIFAIKGEIQNISVDVVVNPTDAAFSMEGKIGQLLEHAGGKDFSQVIEEIKLENGILNRMDVVMSLAINAFAKYAIHCRGPELDDKKAAEKLEDLAEKCLNLADSRYCKSIAFPVLGLCGLQEDAALEILLHTVGNYFMSVMTTSIAQLYFLVSDSESINRIPEEFK